MVAALLLRGMLAGIVAGLLCFAFLRVVGERPIDQAIAFNPGGGIANPNAPGRRVVDAAGLGMRTAITF